MLSMFKKSTKMLAFFKKLNILLVLSKGNITNEYNMGLKLLKDTINFKLKNTL